jgi:RNA polymerase sigma-70 factor (ECF subfamily)
MSDSDIHLVERALLKDEDAFAALHTRHSRFVYRLCIRMVKSHTEAEDCTQEVFIKAYLHLETFRGNSQFRTWLGRIAINTCLMSIRKEKGRSTVASIDEIVEGDDGNRLKYDFGCRDATLESMPDREILRLVMTRLPKHYRKIFILGFVEDTSNSDLCWMLDIPLSRVKSQKHYAMKRARRIVAGLGVSP